MSDFPDQPAYRAAVAALSNNQAAALQAAGRHDLAVTVFGRAADAYRQIGGVKEAARRAAEKCFWNYAAALKHAGRDAEAASVESERRSLFAAASPADRTSRTVATQGP